MVVTSNPKTARPNGWLLEVVSDTDHFTKNIRGQIYLITVNPGEFKGFHMHAGADYFVTCLKGRVKQIVYKSLTEKQEVIMGDRNFKTTFLPKNHPHAVQNIGKDVAYVLVYRYPAWSPKIKEQFDIAPEEIRTPEVWKKIALFIKDFNKKR